MPRSVVGNRHARAEADIGVQRQCFEAPAQLPLDTPRRWLLWRRLDRIAPAVGQGTSREEHTEEERESAGTNDDHGIIIRRQPADYQ